MRKLHHLFWLLFFWLLIPPPSLAADYRVDLRLSALYKSSQNAQSTLKLSFRNLSSDKFITSFDLDLPATENFSFTAADDIGPVKTEIIPSNYGRQLHFYFNRLNVGKNKTYHLSVNFPLVSPSKKDNLREISLPSFQTAIPPDSYIVEVIVPASFGQLISAPSAPDETKNSSDTRSFIFSGLSPLKINRLLLGDLNSFRFTAYYHQSDPPAANLSESILLPKDSPGQKVFIHKFSATPENVYTDVTDNWVALYSPPLPRELSVEGFVLLDSPDKTIFFSPDSLALPPDRVDIIPYPYPYQDQFDPNLQITGPSLVIPFLSTPLTVEISNPYPAAVYNYSYRISSPNFYLSGDLENNIPILPPHSHTSYRFYVQPKFPQVLFSTAITVSANRRFFTYNVSYLSLSLWYLLICVCFSFLIIFFSFLAYRTGRIHIRRSRR